MLVETIQVSVFLTRPLLYFVAASGVVVGADLGQPTGRMLFFRVG